MVNSLRTDFCPNLYNFDPEELKKEAQKEGIPDLSRIFKAKFMVNGELDVINARNFAEALLGYRAKIHKFSPEPLHQYLDCLLDSNRFEEVIQICDQLEATPNFDSSILYHLRVVAALLMEEPERVSKYIPSTMEPDAPIEDWMFYIEYHRLLGKQNELLLKPMPNNTAAKFYLLFVCDCHLKIYSLFQRERFNDPAAQWIVWLTYKKLKMTGEALVILTKILSIKTPLNFFTEKLVLDELENEVFLKDEICKYLEDLKTSRPFTPRLLLAAAQVNPTKKAQYLEWARKICSSFPNLTNKRFVIKASLLDPAKKMELLEKALRVSRIKLSYFVEVASFYANDVEKLLSICKQVEESENLPQAVRIRIAAIRSANAVTVEARRNALEIINETLKISPYSRNLLFNKAYLLVKLSRVEEAIQTIDFYFAHFEYDVEMVIISYEVFEKRNEIDKAIAVLKKCYLQFRLDTPLNILSILYKKYKTPEEYLQFLNEYVFKKNHVETKKWFEEAKKIISKMEEPQRGMQILKSVARGSNNLFLTLRAEYLHANDDLEDALEDVEHICKTEENISYKVQLLIDLNRLTLAFDELTKMKVPGADAVCEKLILALESEEGFHEEIIKLAEMYKPKSYLAKRALAYAYIDKKEHDNALSIFNRLKIEDPKDIDIFCGRVLCYQAKNLHATALDVLHEGLSIAKDHLLLRSLEIELKSAKESKDSDSKKEVTVQKSNKPNVRVLDEKKVTYLIESDKEISRAKQAHLDRKDGSSSKSVHLQKSSHDAVDPLSQGFSLKEIKEIARRGERETSVPESRTLAAAPLRPKVLLPTLLVKANLKDFEKVFLNKGLDVLIVTLKMNANTLPNKIVKNNYIYSLLRLFTPIRLNTLSSFLREDLRAIRNDARHASDLILDSRLSALFQYLKDIRLDAQIRDWIDDKGVITTLVLRNHTLTADGQRKFPIQRIIEELDFIKTNLGEKSTWNERIYHRNAIKASLSIIGEASNFVSDELRILLTEFREEGNKIAHHFFEDGDTFEYTEKYKDEEISSDALWELSNRGIAILEKLLKGSP